MFNDHTPRTHISDDYISRKDAARAFFMASAIVICVALALAYLYGIKTAHDARVAVERECLSVLADQAYQQYLEQMPQSERDAPPRLIIRPVPHDGA